MKKVNFLAIIICMLHSGVLSCMRTEKTPEEIVDAAGHEIQLKYIQTSIIEKWLLADDTINKLNKIDLKNLTTANKRYIKNLVASYNTTIGEENNVPASINRFLNNKEILNNKDIDSNKIQALKNLK